MPLLLHPQAKELIEQRMHELAREKGKVFRLRPTADTGSNMGVFPQGADIIPNPYNKIPGFSCARVHFVRGFPVMATPMIESVLDTCYHGYFQVQAWVEQSVIVFNAIEADPDAADGADRVRTSGGQGV